MELRHLRYFVSVAEALSFTKAAEKLHTAQPSLTRQIRNLEEELGVRLLHRTKQKVSLTDEGRSAFARGSAIQQAAERDLFGVLSDDEAVQLHALLAKLSRSG